MEKALSHSNESLKALNNMQSFENDAFLKERMIQHISKMKELAETKYVKLKNQIESNDIEMFNCLNQIDTLLYNITNAVVRDINDFSEKYMPKSIEAPQMR